MIKTFCDCCGEELDGGEYAGRLHKIIFKHLKVPKYHGSVRIIEDVVLCTKCLSESLEKVK